MITAIAILILAGIEIYKTRRIERLLRAICAPREETQEDKEKTRLIKQWNAIMTYGGDADGTKQNDDA